MTLRNKYTGEVMVCGEGIIEFKTFGCKNLAEFLEAGWEDYKPDEPLIKDEKIRKAVRAWAEANEIDTAQYDEYWESFRSDDRVIGFKGESIFKTFSNLDDGKWYFISDLCGEEEE